MVVSDHEIADDPPNPPSPLIRAPRRRVDMTYVPRRYTAYVPLLAPGIFPCCDSTAFHLSGKKKGKKKEKKTTTARGTVRFSFEDEEEVKYSDWIKNVHAPAVSEMSMAWIVATVSPKNPSSNNIPIKEMKRGAFTIPKAAFRNGSLSTGTMKINPRGKLTALGMELFAQYGLDLHFDDNKLASHTHGGHPHFRNLINAMIA